MNYYLTNVYKAAEEGSLEQVKFLIENGADIPNCLLFIASGYGHLEIVKYLINHYDNHEKQYALAEAVKYNKINVIKYFLSIGLNINYKYNCNYTLLLYASEYGHLEVMKYLINNGANINDIDNKNSLILAIQHDHTKIVKYLLSKLIDIDNESLLDSIRLKGCNGIIRRRNCRIIIIKYLIKKGYKFNEFFIKYINDDEYLLKYFCKLSIINNYRPTEYLYNYANKNKLWLFYIKQEPWKNTELSLLNKIDSKINIHQDLIKYICKFV